MEISQCITVFVGAQVVRGGQGVEASPREPDSHPDPDPNPNLNKIEHRATLLLEKCSKNTYQRLAYLLPPCTIFTLIDVRFKL